VDECHEWCWDVRHFSVKGYELEYYKLTHLFLFTGRGGLVVF
jgi:hypothetical protein